MLGDLEQAILLGKVISLDSIWPSKSFKEIAMELKKTAKIPFWLQVLVKREKYGLL